MLISEMVFERMEKAMTQAERDRLHQNVKAMCDFHKSIEKIMYNINTYYSLCRVRLLANRIPDYATQIKARSEYLQLLHDMRALGGLIYDVELQLFKAATPDTQYECEKQDSTQDVTVMDMTLVPQTKPIKGGTQHE